MTEIKDLEAKLEEAKTECKNIEETRGLTEGLLFKRNRDKLATEAGLPEICALDTLHKGDQKAPDKALNDIAELDRVIKIYEAALIGLEPVYQAAREAMTQAEKALHDHLAWQEFGILKEQLLEKYDEKVLKEAKRVAHNIDRHGPGSHAYGNLVEKLRKLNPRLDISY